MVMMSLVMLLTEGARTSGARFMSEYAVDIGSDSLLAEYHRELFYKYNLLFIDTSYGTPQPDLGKTSAHMRDYVDKNLAVRGLAKLAGGTDLYGLSAGDVSSTNASYITDNSGEVFRRQAEEERRQMLGLTLISDLTGLGERTPQGITEGKYDSLREEVESGINEARNTKIKISEDEYENLEVNNPADGINSKRGMGALVLAMKDTSGISKAKVDLNNRIGRRAINMGIGVNPEKYAPETPADKLLFKDYIKTYFGCYGKELEDSYLQYEREYILLGKESDLENLEGVARRLLAVRETSNIEYLLSCESKRMAIKAVASTVSAIATLPWLEPLLEYSILFGWAFAESVTDLRCLFNGGKVPLIKTDASWKTDLDSALENAYMDYDGGGGEGLSYEEYLDMFLMIQNVSEQSERALDIMELTIRKTPGNASFRIDGCIEGLTIQTNIKSRYGDDFYLTRNIFY